MADKERMERSSETKGAPSDRRKPRSHDSGSDRRRPGPPRPHRGRGWLGAKGPAPKARPHRGCVRETVAPAARALAAALAVFDETSAAPPRRATFRQTS